MRSIKGCWVLALIVAPLLLAGCDQAKRAMGYSKKLPDEFNVVTNPPLTMPPEYRLRKPTPGVDAQQREDIARKAQQMLGAEGVGRDGLSSGESILLQKAGADASHEAVRAQLATEKGADEKDESLWRQLKDGTLIVDKRSAEEKADVIDPQNEAGQRPTTSPDVNRVPEGYLDNVTPLVP